jgi:hypothetical protein
VLFAGIDTPLDRPTSRYPPWVITINSLAPS